MTSARSTAAENAALHSGRCDATRLGAIVAVLRANNDPCHAGADLQARFQQLAGAAMAKGVEDTAFYRYVRLVALNEVGSDPDRTIGLDEFHATCATVANEQPLDAARHDHARHASALRMRACAWRSWPKCRCAGVNAWVASTSLPRGIEERRRRHDRPSTCSIRRWWLHIPSMRTAPGRTCARPRARRSARPTGSIRTKGTRKISNAMYAR